MTDYWAAFWQPAMETMVQDVQKAAFVYIRMDIFRINDYQNLFYNSLTTKHRSAMTINPPQAPDRLQQELQELFDTAPPYYLRKSLTDLFFAYLSQVDDDDHQLPLRETATDLYALLLFLEKAGHAATPLPQRPKGT